MNDVISFQNESLHRYTSFDVFATDGEKPLDLAADAQTLGCTEVGRKILKFCFSFPTF